MIGKISVACIPPERGLALMGISSSADVIWELFIGMSSSIFGEKMITNTEQSEKMISHLSFSQLPYAELIRYEIHLKTSKNCC